MANPYKPKDDNYHISTQFLRINTMVLKPFKSDKTHFHNASAPLGFYSLGWQ